MFDKYIIIIIISVSPLLKVPSLKAWGFSLLENLRFNLRKTEGGMGGSTKPEDLLEENRGGMGGGGLDLFSCWENKKNLRYFATVPNQTDNWAQ